MAAPKGVSGAPIATANTNGTPSERMYTLWTHDPNRGRVSVSDCVINPTTFPNVKLGDILEIYLPHTPPEKRLLIQVSDLEGKGPLQIGVSQNIAALFGLQNNSSVCVGVVPPTAHKDVTADLVELTFSNQFIERSDLWRIKLSLINTIIFTKKRVDHGGNQMDVQRIARQETDTLCGLITHDTRLVFRSRSARMYLFIQMSSEMWDFAENGVLYFEKTIQGFLTTLFQRWRTLPSNHTVSIVLFSRTYYKRTPTHTDFHNLQQDAYGRLYQDFYKVVVNAEARADWMSVLYVKASTIATYIQSNDTGLTSVDLKREFIRYPRLVHWSAKYSASSGEADPDGGVNSSAAQGNFLEALNIPLKAIERHYVDIDLSYTGRSILVVTAGTGVFEVDMSLAKITKQRIIDLGVGVDLICMTQPPLHSVPLFKYINDSTGASYSSSLLGESLKKARQTQLYATPHWIYISYFQEPKRKKSSGVVPFITSGGGGTPTDFTPVFKMPEVLYSSFQSALRKRDFFVPCELVVPSGESVSGSNTPSDSEALIMQFVTAAISPRRKYYSLSHYNSYDEAVFIDPELRHGGGLAGRSRSTSDETLPPTAAADPASANTPRDDSDSEHSSGENSEDDNDEPRNNITRASPSSASAGSRGTQQPRFSRPQATRRTTTQGGEANIPPALTLQGASNPVPIGVPARIGGSKESRETSPVHTTAKYPRMSPRKSSIGASPVSGKFIGQRTDQSADGTGGRPAKGTFNPFNPRANKLQRTVNKRRWSQLFPEHQAPSEVQHLNERLKTDEGHWKSLSEPAVLPLTTDYFPSAVLLNDPTKYLQQNYILHVPETQIERIIKELVAQRLAQGYQIITSHPQLPAPSASASPSKPSRLTSQATTYFLSFGKIFHYLSYNFFDQYLEVKSYKPNHQARLAAASLLAPTAAPAHTLSTGLAAALAASNAATTARTIAPSVPPVATTPSVKSPLPYVFHIWPAHGDSYIPTRMFIPHIGPAASVGDAGAAIASDPEGYHWNRLDALLCGFEDEFRDELKFARARYALIPPCSFTTGTTISSPGGTPSPSRDDIVGAFNKFIDFLSQPFRSAERRPLDVTILTNTLASPREATLAGSALAASTLGLNEQPTDEVLAEYRAGRRLFDATTQLETMLELMKSPNGGVDIQSRWYRLRNYPKCFLGADAADWLVKHVNLPGRDDARRLAQRLIDEGHIVPVFDKHRQFTDTPSAFYRFKDHALTRTPSRLNLASPLPATSAPTTSLQTSTEALSSTPAVANLMSPLSPSGFGSITPASSSPPSAMNVPLDTAGDRKSLLSIQLDNAQVRVDSALPPAAKIQQFLDELRKENEKASRAKTKVSNKLRIDLDSSRTGKEEWLVLQYDAFFDPYRWYQLEFQWIVCTAGILSDFLTACTRRAKAAGLTLVQIPTLGLENYLELPVYISLPVSPYGEPWPSTVIPVIQKNLLISFSFIPGNRAAERPQLYIHRTGTALVHCTADGFIWTVNYFAMKARDKEKEKERASMDDKCDEGLALLHEFRAFCANSAKVAACVDGIVEIKPAASYSNFTVPRPPRSGSTTDLHSPTPPASPPSAKREQAEQQSTDQLSQPAPGELIPAAPSETLEALPNSQPNRLVANEWSINQLMYYLILKNKQEIGMW